MGYKSEQIKREFLSEIKKVKSNKDIKATTHKFVIERIGTRKVIADKEKYLINKLEKAIPEDKIHLLKDLLKYKKQSEKFWMAVKIIDTVDFMLKFGLIIIKILTDIMQYDIEEKPKRIYKKETKENKEVDA